MNATATERVLLDDTTPHQAALRAHAVLEQGRFSWFWIVPDCPFCHKLHDHYAGPLNGDPQGYLGRPFPARCDRTDRRQLAIQYNTGALWYVIEPTPDPVDDHADR